MSQVISNPSNQTSGVLCKFCKNYGYYEVGISQTPNKMQMFCACTVGQNLKKLSFEWRLNDMKTICDNVNTRLRIIKGNLHEPSKASNFIDALIVDTEEVVRRSERGLAEANK